LQAAPTNNIIGKPFVQLTSVDSTNNYAMGRVQKGLATHGEAYFAWEQTKGKGQREKQWLSTRGENIILSIVLDTSAFFLHKQFFLSMAAALSARDLFNKYTTNKALIKWPNDIYFGDRKAGGILIENIVTGKEWQWAIAGIGININQTIFDETVINAVSLKQITGKNFDPLELTKELCTRLDHRFRQLHINSRQSVVDAYNNILYKKGQKVSLKKNNIVFECLIKGVNEYGYLITESATEQLFNAGEVQWIR